MIEQSNHPKICTERRRSIANPKSMPFHRMCGLGQRDSGKLMITQRKVIGTCILYMFLGVSLLALGSRIEAQQHSKLPRVGFLANTKNTQTIEPFRRGLKTLGYSEGLNIRIEYRYFETKRELIPPLIAELVHMNVDALVVGAPPAIRARDATKNIPIVIVTNQDPVAAGYVRSLARPGGNTTGVTNLTRELSGKRLELLREVVPKLFRVGILWNIDARDIGFGRGFKEYEFIARSLNFRRVLAHTRCERRF
jgi:ABC-type uncharacterized transport system substrate-binding protein